MARLSFTYVFITLVFCLQWSQTAAILRYIDDQEGDEITGIPPVFFRGSNSVWSNSFSGCASCDPGSLPFNGTYMDTSSNSSIGTPATVNFSFKGTSIEIFVFTSDVKNDPSDPETVYNTHLNFVMDGTQAGKFDHVSNGTGNANDFTDGLTYYVSAFKQTGLALKNHTFVIQNIGISHLWFDYAQYDDGKPDPNPPPASVTNAASGGKASGFGSATAKDPSNTSKTAASSSSTSSPGASSSTGTVIKAAAAGAAAVLLLIGAIVGFIFWRKKNRRRAQGGYGGFDPATPKPPAFASAPEKTDGSHFGSPSQQNLMYNAPNTTSPAPSVPYNQNSYNGSYNGGWNQGPDATSPANSYNTPTSAYPLMGNANTYPPPPNAPFPGGFNPGYGPQSNSPSVSHTGSPPPPSPQPTVSTHIPGAGYVMSPPTDGISDSVRAKQAEREEEYARYVREREEALLARANTANSGQYQQYGYDAPAPQPQSSYPAMVPASDPSSAAIRAKQAEREAEYARYMQQRNDPMRMAGSSQQQQPYPSNDYRAPSAAPSTHSAHAPIDPSNAQVMQAEMKRLREQMSRMQAVQNQVVAELGAAPPPLYSERGGPGATAH